MSLAPNRADTPATPPGPVGGEWPLTGRTGELRILEGQLARPDARGLVLAGPPGVGKTRLGLECLRLAEQAGRPTARASASRAASALPFGAVAPLLPDAGYASAVGGDRAELLRRFSAALAVPAGGERLVLLVDDAHLLDDSSATLIYHLAVAGSALLVLTVRVREPAPEPVTALWKDGLLERLEIAELDGESLDELLRKVLGGPVDRGAIVRIASRCQGNVLFLRELVLGAVAAGTLICDAGVWRLAGPLAPSQRLVELVQNRLAGLEPDERALVEVVAVAESLGPAELASHADLSVAESLERKGLLVSEVSGRRLEFRLAHPLYSEVLRSQSSSLRTKVVARALAGVVEEAGARRAGDRLQLARWLLDAGEARPDVMLSAAKTARDRYDFVLAERLARAAAGAGAGLEAAVLAARLASLAGRGPQAEAELAPLEAEATTEAEAALVTISRVDNLRFMGQSAEAMRVADAATGVVDAAWRAEIDARRCGLLLELEGPQAAADAAGALCTRASGSALVSACLVATYGLSRAGRFSDAAEAAARAHEVAATLPGGSPPWAAYATVAQTEMARQEGRLADAWVLVSDLYDQSLADGSIDAQAYAAWGLARIALDQGRVTTAARYGREAAVLLRQVNRLRELRDCLVTLAAADALRPDPGKAATGVVLAEIDSLGIGDSVWMVADLLIARAWTTVAGRDLTGARGFLEAAAVTAERTGDRVGQVNALHTLARLGHSKEVAARLAGAAEGVEGDLAPAQAAHAQAGSRGDPAALEQASASFEALGASLLAAEAAADAAVAWRRELDPRAAAAAERRALDLAAACEGATTPALGAVESRALLTAAERETALLAAAGRSNKEIAEQLLLSVRTVENYLHRVYEKLGVSGRSELAAALEG